MTFSLIILVFMCQSSIFSFAGFITNFKLIYLLSGLFDIRKR